VTPLNNPNFGEPYDQLLEKIYELIIDWLVGFFVVELAHPASSHRLGTGAIIFFVP
jgi:hypothetical protein